MGLGLKSAEATSERIGRTRRRVAGSGDQAGDHLISFFQTLEHFGVHAVADAGPDFDQRQHRFARGATGDHVNISGTGSFRARSWRRTGTGAGSAAAAALTAEPALTARAAFTARRA